MAFKIGVALESLQYLDNHKQRLLNLRIDCQPTDRTWQLYFHVVTILITYEGTNI